MTLLPQSTIHQIAMARFPINRAKIGTKQGYHRSFFTGSSNEFSQHRQYCPGDEPKRIDWRVLARTDRLMVKQYDQETNLRATLLIDSSASMGYRNTKAKKTGAQNPTKLMHASRLAAALAWILIRQGDAVGMISFSHQITCRTTHASTPAHLHRLLASLESLRPQQSSESASVLHDIAEILPSRGLIVLCSDLLSDPESLRSALFHLQHRHHEIVVIQVLAPDELDFPFNDSLCFRDMECKSQLFDVDTLAIRNEYRSQLTQHLKEIEQACCQVQADYLLTTTDQEVPNVLTAFLARRYGRTAGGLDPRGGTV
jgi:uncharacterized protein (DUF58 family)